APVEIEEVEALAVRQREVGAQAPAGLSPPDGEIVVLRPGDGESREDRVAVGTSRPDERRAIRYGPPEKPSEVGGVVRHLERQVGGAGPRPVGIAYFLERRDVAAQSREDGSDPRQIAASVAAEPSVDVPGDEPHGRLNARA